MEQNWDFGGGIRGDIFVEGRVCAREVLLIRDAVRDALELHVAEGDITY